MGVFLTLMFTVVAMLVLDFVLSSVNKIIFELLLVCWIVIICLYQFLVPTVQNLHFSPFTSTTKGKTSGGLNI